MMPTKTPPRKFNRVINAVIEHAVRGAPPPKDLQLLTGWYESDGWEVLMMAWESSGENCALKLEYLSKWRFTDKELRENYEFKGKIQNSQRIAFARELIATYLEELDGYLCPSIHIIEISNNKDEHAVLAWLVEIHGQAGPAPLFQGIFQDNEAFYQYLRKTGYLVSIDGETITDEEILQLWEKPVKKSRQ